MCLRRVISSLIFWNGFGSPQHSLGYSGPLVSDRLKRKLSRGVNLLTWRSAFTSGLYCRNQTPPAREGFACLPTRRVLPHSNPRQATKQAPPLCMPSPTATCCHACGQHAGIIIKLHVVPSLCWTKWDKVGQKLQASRHPPGHVTTCPNNGTRVWMAWPQTLLSRIEVMSP
jgi:hypothetical protein